MNITHFLNSIFNINENRNVIYQKKLDYKPRTFYVYNITDHKY